MIFTLRSKLTKSTSFCQFCLLTFRCYQLPVLWSCFGVHVIFILHIFQFLYMPKWKIQHAGTSHGFMTLSGGTLCSEPNEWIILIHMRHFPAVGDMLLLFRVYFAACTRACWAGSFVESLSKPLWSRLLCHTRTQSWARQSSADTQLLPCIKGSTDLSIYVGGVTGMC